MARGQKKTESKNGNGAKLSFEQVKSTVETVLDQNLPESYDRVLFKSKCDILFHLIYDHASNGLNWAV